MGIPFRLTILVLATLALGFWPRTAAAVLFPDLAASFDTAPAYLGCPAIGAGESQPQPALCATLKTPEDYCMAYHATKSLEKDPDATKANQACVAFFGAAVNSQQLLCDYQKEATALEQTLDAAAQNVDGARKAQNEAGSATMCARKVYGYYRMAALKQLGVLAKIYKSSSRLILNLGDVGANHVLAEVNCQKNGVPGAAPGYLLVGMSTHWAGDEKQTNDNISGTLNRFQMAMMTQFGSAGGTYDQIAKRESDLNSVMAVRGMGTTSNASDITDSSQADPGDENYAVKGGVGMANGVVTNAATAVAKSEEHQLVGSAVRSLVAAQATTVTGAAGANVGGMVIGLGVTYLKNGKVQSGDLATALFTTGVGTVAMVVGAPAVVTVGATVGAGLLADKIRNDFNAYDREVVKPFIVFAKPIVKAESQVTSDQISQDYNTQKQKLAYCSKCNDRDIQMGCPGMAGALHGLNKDYMAPAGAAQVLFANPWVEKAYEDYRAHNPNGNMNLPFNGPGNVSPISVAP